VVVESLNPDWNEAFVLGADEIEDAILAMGPRLLFEVWDSDVGLLADDFLGQVPRASCQRMMQTYPPS
jgi:hypothetical protein